MTSSPKQLVLIAGLTVSGLIASGLTAQSKPATVLPADPLFTFHIDGPASLRAAFLPTNLGKLFSGAEFQDMIAPVTQFLEAAKGEGGPQLPFDAKALEAAILNYSGRVSAAFHVLDETIDFNAEPPSFAITVVLTPDGKTDLAGFCKQAHGIASEKMGERLQDMEVGGTTLSYIHDEDSDEPGVTVPFMHEGHAVFLVTKDFKKAATAVLLDDARHHTPEPRFATASVGVSVHMKRLFTLIAGGLKDSLGPMWDGMGAHIYKGSGLQSLQTIDVVYRAKGPAVVSEAVVNFNQDDRGILGAFFGAQAGRSPLIDLLPRNAMTASASPFDLKPVYKGVKSIFSEMGDSAPMPFEEVEEGFKEHFGLRLFEDLIGLFGQDVMWTQLETDENQGGNPLAGADGSCIGLATTNGAKLRTTIDAMLRKDGLHAGRKKEEYKGFTVYNLNLAMALEIYYAVTDDLLLIGVGDTGGDAVRATLDAVKNRADGKDADPLPAEIANRLKMVKGGYAGFGWSDLGQQVESILDLLDLAGGELPPEFDVVGDILDKLPKLFKDYKLKYQVGVSRHEGSRWVYENIW